MLAPLVLAHWAGARDRRNGTAAIDVAPQFDSVATLEGCGEVMRQLLADQVYQRHLAARQRQQTVLIGYSESNLESGMVASRLAAYQAQRTLAAALDRAQDRHVLFYSRGGSIPRGGGRIDASAARRTGRVGQRSFEIYRAGRGHFAELRFAGQRNAHAGAGLQYADTGDTGSTPRGALSRRAPHLPRQRCSSRPDQPQRLADLLDGPGFFEFFRAATPIDVIERMRIGAVQRRESAAERRTYR